MCILVWVAVVAAVGIPLYRMGITGPLPLLWLNLVATVTLVAPVTVVLAGLESSAREASFGKSVRRLKVVSARTGARVSFRHALARNVLKVALPWTIGHAAVYGIVAAGGTGAVPLWVWAATAIAYVLPIAYVVSLFVGTGLTPYDRLSGTAVVTARADP